MKIVKLMGGLGNQMFQYAFGQVLGKEVYYDKTDYQKKLKSITPRFYELSNWNVKPSFANEQQIKNLKNEKYGKSRLSGFFRKLLKIPKVQYQNDIRKEKIENVYDASLFTVEGYFEGYFQCAKYYDSIQPQLLKEFTPAKNLDAKNKEILKQIHSCQSVSLHVRRTDYLGLPEIYGSCDLKYYQKSIDYIVQHIKSPHFFLFSDDIPWVKENLKLDFPYTIVDINHDRNCFLDIWLMKHCKHNIIANSSFSWWGAWLNENPNKIVVAPKNWFADGRPCEIVPKNWIKI